MPVHIQWGDPQKASIQITFISPFDLNDWYDSVTKTCIMLNTVQHSVNIIIDLSYFDSVPMQLIDALNSSKSRYHDNQSAQIAVVQRPVLIPMQTLLNDTDMFHGTAIVSSLIEAYQMPNTVQEFAKVG